MRGGGSEKKGDLLGWEKWFWKKTYPDFVVGRRAMGNLRAGRIAGE